MILSEDLSKQFDAFTAVDGVSLDVPAGKVLALLGPNGAGKTTTVRMLSSVLTPSRGKAFVAGFDVVKQPEKVRAAVGVLTEHHGLYVRMNSVEYLEFFGSLYSLEKKACRQRIHQLLEHFGLADAKKKRLGEYSKGMRQKLALVRTLLHDPPVLLLDEPTSAMDPESSHMVREALLKLRSGERTILLCTHNLYEAEELADQIAIIRRGRIILNDTPVNMKRRMLGPSEYKALLNQRVDGYSPHLPDGVELTGRGEDWLLFRVENPAESNPQLVREMLAANLELVSFQEVAHSLEEAYLAAMNHEEAQEAARC